MQKFGFIFPGQGSQKLGMLSGLAGEHAIIEKTFAEASEVLQIDLWEITQYDGANNLDQTEITQPVLVTAAVAIWRLWQQQQGSEASILAGHSLGEYSALVCAGVLDFADAINLVHHRGKLMSSAVPAGTGKMAAIVGLENYLIDEICDEAEQRQVVSAANFNSPGQTVIAGNIEAVERAMVLCKEAGAKRVVPLNVSVPSHCELMRPAAKKLEQDLARITFNPASIPVVQNASAEIGEDPELIKLNLIKQLYSPVLWEDSVRLIYKAGITRLVECGPGQVLCGLIKRIEPELVCFGSDDVQGIASAMADTSA